MGLNVDKKSLIQITILVVVVVAGAGMYLSNQEGGLGFITDLLPGADKQAAPVAVVPPKPAEPIIPAQPAKGEIAGKPFDPEAVVLESGVLTFVQSKDPQPIVRVRLGASKWETPAGKNFKYAPAGANAPIVTVGHIDAGKMKEQSVSDKYTLYLEFGQEKGGKLPGKIHLALTGDPTLTLAGTFDADIKGFRIIDGKPDLSADSNDTLEYLTLKELLKDDPDRQIEVIAFRDHRFTADKTRAGYVEVEYRFAQGNADIKRFQFVKDPEWKVRAAPLALNQIDEAHPVVVPGPKDKPEQVLSYLAAKQLEAGAKKKAAKGLYGVSFVTRHNLKTKLGVAEASYKFEPDGQALKTSYLFRLKQGGWAFERELGAKDKVNVDTGKAG